MNLLIGVSGSVATTLVEKLIAGFLDHNPTLEIRLVYTGNSVAFYDQNHVNGYCAQYGDRDEYPMPFRYAPQDPITHKDLADWGDVFLIAPCSANTMGKIASGIADNLLTTLARIWDPKKPFYIAPAMNTQMWVNRVTGVNLASLEEMGVQIIWPSVRQLACGDYGIGALADIWAIRAIVTEYRWESPLRGKHNQNCYPGHKPSIPTNGHPGGFGFERKHYIHPGVDLYHYDKMFSPWAQEGVYSMAPGIIVDINTFTGAHENPPTPWWNDTWHVTVYDETLGLNICYCEIIPNPNLKQWDRVATGEHLGDITPVLKRAPQDPPYAHSTHMLHLELVEPLETTTPRWELGEQRPKTIKDPSALLRFGPCGGWLDGYRGDGWAPAKGLYQ